MAVMASTMGTARGNTQGSWRPRALRVVVRTIQIYGVLFHEYGCHRFEGHAEVDVLSVADAALNTAGMVGVRFDAPVVVEEYVVLFRALHFSPLNPSPYSNALAALMLSIPAARADWSFP